MKEDETSMLMCTKCSSVCQPFSAFTQLHIELHKQKLHTKFFLDSYYKTDGTQEFFMNSITGSNTLKD